MVPEAGMNPMLSRVVIRPVQASDAAELVAANLASIDLHEPWVSPCRDHASFLGYLARCDGDRSIGFIARERESGKIVGVVNVSETVGLVVTHAFRELGLHRVEANIQPGNEPSRALVKRLGFRQEGYSPRYLKIDGDWRDHERWAVLAEEW